jgi:hypothetical protein
MMTIHEHNDDDQILFWFWFLDLLYPTALIQFFGWIAWLCRVHCFMLHFCVTNPIESPLSIE